MYQADFKTLTSQISFWNAYLATDCTADLLGSLYANLNFRGPYNKLFFCFNRAKNTRIALLIVLFFNDRKIIIAAGKNGFGKTIYKDIWCSIWYTPF